MLVGGGIPTQGNREVNLLIGGDTNPGELGSELLVGEDTNQGKWEVNLLVGEDTNPGGSGSELLVGDDTNQGIPINLKILIKKTL